MLWYHFPTSTLYWFGIMVHRGQFNKFPSPVSVKMFFFFLQKVCYPIPKYEAN